MTNLTDFIQTLRQQVQGEVWDDTYSKILYSTDASIYQVLPHGVLIPQSVEDVQAAVALAARHKIPILPRTAGSSLAGQAVNEALIIDMSTHLDQIIELNVEERWVQVQPGVVLDQLNEYLKPHGLQFGPDPASSNRAGLGGIVANNSTGSHSILVGMTADHVLETRVILSDGTTAHFTPLTGDQLRYHQQKSGLEGQLYHQLYKLSQTQAEVIRQGTPQHWRRCGGYNLDRLVQEGIAYNQPQDPRFNLSKLICGSEGTLGVMTEIKLNLVPRPKRTALALVAFAELHPALSATTTILEVEPSAVELMDNLGLTMCRNVPQYARLLKRVIPDAPYCIQIVEFYGENEAELQAKLTRLEQTLRHHQVGATTITPIIQPELQADVWAIRKAGLGFLMSLKGDYKPIPFIEDSAVPVEHLADYITRLEAFCHTLDTRMAYYAHASGGCLHVRPLINAKVASDVNKLPDIASFAVELLGKYGGTLSSEHGDGRARSWLNERFFGKPLYNLYRQVKHSFDPENIFNPGNIVEAGSMLAHLRYGEGYTATSLPEHLDFTADQGLQRAVEMCNGAAVCRKQTSGTMCPPFMVTREEEHSTRGRANALRAALSGQLPATELTSPRMHAVMDLCVQCKACKAECPSSVDMAKLKVEFLAHYHEAQGIPLRSRIFADIQFLSHLSSGFTAPLVNRITQNRWVRYGLERLLGISQQRTLPTFSSNPFNRWFRLRKRTLTTNGQSSKKQVVLFNDTFNNYNEPQVLIAATELLEAAGFEVLLPGHRCCGRAMISKGLVHQARRQAKQTLKQLLPFVQRGIPIVGFEPSCLLTMRDEYYDLLPHDNRVDIVAQHCFTIEEFISQLAEQDNLSLTFREQTGHILLHGHCHQKSLVGTAPSHHMLSLPGYTITEVDSGCCGLAGSFGYEAEHYDLSIAMSERRLFPAIREQEAGTLIVAAGISCRQQIRHGTGRRALHPVEILRAAL